MNWSSVYCLIGASSMAQQVKETQEMPVQSLGQQDPQEKEMTTHTPVSLPGNSHGQRSLLDYSPEGRKESDTTERPSTQLSCLIGTTDDHQVK